MAAKAAEVTMSIQHAEPADDTFTRPRHDAPYMQFDKIERSDSDTRQYRLLKLDNQLEALLIHDPDTDKASAALDVHVGSMADPPQLQGLAHFCEHMLFLGTDKYPQENEYNRFLTEHGGHSNAYTAQEHTNYYFEVNHPSLEGALDRFARFFIAPRFDASCTEREMKAVDSEHKKNLQSDSWRFYQLEKSLSNPEHPYAKFSTGSLETLKEGPESAGIDVREALLDFHRRHYSANQMKLVVLGRESLDQLAEWVTSQFLSVPNHDLPNPTPLPNPYDASRLMKQITARPIKDQRLLEISWPFPDQEMNFRVQPGSYLGHLIGHEGAGSIIAFLKQKGWANHLSAGCSGGASGFDFFKVSIDLTQEGLSRYEQVVALVFQYIVLLRRTGIQAWSFNEVRDISVLDFRFKEKSPASSYASTLAGQLHRPYPRSWVLSGGYVVRDYSPELIISNLDALSHDNMNVFLKAQGLEMNEIQKEKWYGTEYQHQPISPSLQQTLKKISTGEITADENLHLPKPNEFIPSEFDTNKHVVKDVATRPRLILNTPLIKLWHKKDDTFWLPKAHTWFSLKSPLAYNTPRNCVLARLYAEVLRDTLNQYTYDAEVSGLGYHLEMQQDGILLCLDGYNHKMPLLARKVVEQMRNLKIDSQRFDLIKEQLYRAYKNFDLDAPYEHAIYYMTYLTQERMWSNQEELDQIQSITCEELERYYPQFLQQMHIEAVVYGNIAQEVAVEMVQHMEQTLHPLPMTPSQLLNSRCVLLPRKGARYVYQRMVPNPDNVNSAIEYYCQVGDVTDTRLRALLALISQVINEPCFNQLRTKEQLGYLVFSGVRKQPGVMGLRIIIQSERDPIYLEHRIEAFLVQLETILKQMTQEEFERHIASLCAFERYWNYVNSGYYEFDQIKTDVANLKNLKPNQLLAFYKHYIDPRSRHQCKLSVHLASTKLLSDPNRSAIVPTTSITKAELDHARSFSDDRLEWALRSNDVVSSLGRLLVDAAPAENETAVEELMRQLDRVLTAENGVLAQIGLRREKAIQEGDGQQLLPDNEIIHDINRWKSMMEMSTAPYPLSAIDDENGNTSNTTAKL
ncbi:Metalloenzyme, LuxS/M16 peptidase-like protein [Syncephalis fuscata]|nr:Metalloenzyme, LuxS/M16 peptidase-like protein [Syncephalis fuscata]